MANHCLYPLHGYVLSYIFLCKILKIDMERNREIREVIKTVTSFTFFVCWPNYMPAKHTQVIEQNRNRKKEMFHILISQNKLMVSGEQMPSNRPYRWDVACIVIKISPLCDHILINSVIPSLPHNTQQIDFLKHEAVCSRLKFCNNTLHQK
jgi:hypothetical protein